MHICEKRSEASERTASESRCSLRSTCVRMRVGVVQHGRQPAEGADPEDAACRKTRSRSTTKGSESSSHRAPACSSRRSAPSAAAAAALLLVLRLGVARVRHAPGRPGRAPPPAPPPAAARGPPPCCHPRRPAVHRPQQPRRELRARRRVGGNRGDVEHALVEAGAPDAPHRDCGGVEHARTQREEQRSSASSTASSLPWVTRSTMVTPVSGTGTMQHWYTRSTRGTASRVPLLMSWRIRHLTSDGEKGFGIASRYACLLCGCGWLPESSRPAPRRGAVVVTRSCVAVCCFKPLGCLPQSWHWRGFAVAVGRGARGAHGALSPA